MAAHHISDDGTDTSIGIPRTYAWIVFALTFGLLISDYMARQVLNAVFPLLKAQWSLSDAQLGLLSGVVAVMVGLLTFPLSLAADRWGYMRGEQLRAQPGVEPSLDEMLRDYMRTQAPMAPPTRGSISPPSWIVAIPRSRRAAAIAGAERIELRGGIRAEAGLALTLVPAKPLVVFGENSVSRKGAAPTAASSSVSTRLWKLSKPSEWPPYCSG